MLRISKMFYFLLIALMLLTGCQLYRPVPGYLYLCLFLLLLLFALRLQSDRSARIMQRELELALRRTEQLETVSQMAASVAHEVRNPMTSVQGFLQLMSRDIPSEHAHAMYLKVMEEDLKRISTIITEYLNVSRISGGMLEEVELGELLQNTCALLQSEANLRGIALTLDLPADSLRLTLEPGGLKQVLINLARNAMEAIGESSGTVTLALEDRGNTVCLKVKDTGPGIHARDLPRIFNPFYTTKATGTGLGLAISKRIIEEQGGSLAVQTEEGKGTTFFLHLPKHPFPPSDSVRRSVEK
ncbi:signal transduction histidine kinase [Tumebacillus sp. BK434]|uniref:ATP-binding protein n=1 Tax=Tumebacillus sp. BK434 TaxID=2512169 RepID=UPI0010EEB639|nr:ATP-binding protein [Tumebacillus sp. BK434]TCP55610.1 signal transduction histidine kinase [Tumebacillus sp. BK434]